MRPLAATHSPEATYRLGLWASSVALGVATAVPTGLVAWRAAAPSPWSLAAGAFLGYGAALLLVAGLRPALSDWLKGFSQNESLLGWLAVALAWLGGAVALTGHWSPLAGLLAVQAVAVPALAREKGYARWYLLNGVTLAMACLSLPTHVAAWSMAAFGAALVSTLAQDSFFHSLLGAPREAGLGANPWTPSRVAARRFAYATPAAALLAWLTPAQRVRPLRPASEAVFRPLSRDRLDTGFAFFEAMAYTGVLALCLIGLAYLHRWLRDRRRRKRSAVAPESLGEPVGGIRRLRSEPPIEPHAVDHTPRGRIVAAFGRFAATAQLRGRPRQASETPREFADGLVAAMVLDRTPAEGIRDAFQSARYEARIPTEADAESFDRLIDAEIAVMESDGHEPAISAALIQLGGEGPNLSQQAPERSATKP